MAPTEDPVDVAWQARREGRHEDAERALLEVITTGRQSGTRLQLIRALKALAHVLRDVGQDGQASPLYEEAVALSREEGDIALLAHTVRHLGDLHRDADRLIRPLLHESLMFALDKLFPGVGRLTSISAWSH